MTVVEGELVHEGELVAYEPPRTPTLFGTSDPAGVVVAATAAAQPLAEVVRKQGLASKISGREHVRVEGWTLLGSMLGVFPVTVWTRKLEDGWEARVEARTRDGAVVGAAEAECLRSESNWSDRDSYALRSMAQTRATSKALRQPLGFVMALGGFDATPAEEMPAEKPKRPAATERSRKAGMRERIRELAGEADQVRGEEKTLVEVEKAFKASFDTTVDKATEEQLRIVGTDLAEWVKAGCKNGFTLVPF